MKSQHITATQIANWGPYGHTQHPPTRKKTGTPSNGAQRKGRDPGMIPLVPHEPFTTPHSRE